jgi:hypothetical protein
MSQPKSSHGEGQPGLHPLCVRDVVVANTSQERPHGIIKGGRKRSDSIRGVDASEIRTPAVGPREKGISTGSRLGIGRELG